MIYPVAERFTSINGEGRKAGELAVFIRFLVYRRITIEYGGSTMVPAEAS